MEKQNVTLSMPKEVLRKAKILATRQGTSLSNLLTQTLKELVAHEEGLRAAHQNHRELLDSGLDLGTKGQTSWTRDELHER